jgi:ferrous iron transport protein B
MASYGPGEKFNNAETIQFSKRKTGIPQEELDNKVAAYKLELLHWNHGKSIEPAISPLGYWKIGIAIISSFAAREVFVGTLATIYSVGTGNEDTIKNKMAASQSNYGKKVFNFASGISLLLFYAFANVPVRSP